MKKISILALAAAGMLFTACSDKDIVLGEGQQGEVLPEGYMALNINLPTTPSTRAANDDFDDGSDNEYKVSDCALLLFQGDSEETATLMNAQVITLPFDGGTDEDVDNDNITTSYLATAQVKGHTAGAKLWALALLNYKNVMSIDENIPTFKSIVDEADGLKKVNANSTLSDIRSLITTADLTTRGGTQNYFFMTNAVLSTDEGGNPVATTITAPKEENVFQLAFMDPSKIKDTREAAITDPAGDIFVERAVAKATLKLSDSFAKDQGSPILGSGEGGLGLKIKDVEWTIDNMESSSYVARNPGKYAPNEDEPEKAVNELKYIGYESGYFPANNTHNFRFVGHTALDVCKTTDKENHDLVSTNKIYRTYWCIDPHYEDILTEAEAGTNWVSAGETPLYCHENTFNVENQNYKNTTRAIIKVTLDDTQDFYTLNGGQERYIDDAIPESGKPDTWKSGEEKVTSHVAGYIANKTAVVSAVATVLKAGQSSGEISSLLKIKYATDTTTGQHKVNEILVDQDDLDKITFTNDEETEVSESVFESNAAETINKVFTEDFINEVNEEYIVRKYTGGVIYYEARFKHFAGDPASNGTAAANDLAPWNVKGVDGKPNNWETAPSGGSTSSAYQAGKAEGESTAKTAEENYLGRYGMVRNNWYEVEITAIDKLGYPADPSGQVNNPKFDDPNTPDDNILEYISAKIHVLSWAKRNQKWGF